MSRLHYPTFEHEQAATALTDFFASQSETETVLLVNSCARGRATADSCLDITVLVAPDVLRREGEALERRWTDFKETANVFERLLQVGAFSHVDLDITDGCFVPGSHSWTSGPDEFELEIGNTLVYSVPLWERGDYLVLLKSQWLPYYDEALRAERLRATLTFCLNNLDHIPIFVNRGLYFQAFDRLYNAYREFLQGLFISRRTYPIAYDKWIREQIEEILGLPELYRRLPRLFEIERFESPELAAKASDLRRLVDEYVRD